MSFLIKQHANTDGAIVTESHARKASRSPSNEHVYCIFVHAGAGYHSGSNERIHLGACHDAAQLAMLILKNGGTALDAVEAAIKTLEDREITNAGYGSNLSMDGVVECDAVIVDHHGRSGAVGAVAQIKNPISLARLVHSHSLQSMTLRRVPPNLLVGQGATDFAIEMDMPTLPHDTLVSPAAKARWIQWRSDLRAAEYKSRKSGNPPSSWKLMPVSTPKDEDMQRQARQLHTETLLQGLSPIDRSSSPSLVDETLGYPAENAYDVTEPLPSHSAHFPNSQATMMPDANDQLPMPTLVRPHTIMESSRNAFINSTQKVPTIDKHNGYRASQDAASDSFVEGTDMQDVHSGPVQAEGSAVQKSWADGSKELDLSDNTDTTLAPGIAINTPLSVMPVEQNMLAPSPGVMTPKETAPLPPEPANAALSRKKMEDNITDTVGAIAIDSWGNIACGASSGGIGMKYRGRVGPAALVGVGAAVVPIDPDDIEKSCVATVTSGTGEHMATTMAATVCAERLYQSIKKGRGGEYVEVSEDEALKAMIENEFMGHPSVKNSHAAGAIGILGVKKVRNGTLLYFGHNTDSFAMASMSSDDPVPLVTMSRKKGNGQIAQGGRVLPLKRNNKKAKSSQRYK